jgi:hypothetical protein
METFEISKYVTMDITLSDDMPIIIDAAGGFININFDELEKAYNLAKKVLKNKKAKTDETKL